MQYRYTILFKPTGQLYHGSKYSKDADPSLFWKKYFTSSNIIKKLIDEYGVDSFEVVEIILHPDNDAYECESDFLQQNKCAASPDWLNESDNNYNLSHTDKIFKDRMINKYGVDHNMKSAILLDKRYKLHEQKYGFGVYNPAQRPEIQEKIKNTCLKKYGVDSPLKSEIIRNKIKSTCLKKYGVNNVFAADIIKEKIKTTFDDKYGCHPRLLKETENKRRKTCIEKYGVDSYSKTDEYKNTIANKVWNNKSDEEKDIIRRKSSEARKNDPIIECEYCSLKVKNKGTFNRFHGVNCKLNPTNPNNIIDQSCLVMCDCGWFPKTPGERSNLLRHYKKCKTK